MKEKLFIMLSALVVFSVGFFSYQLIYPDNLFSRMFQNKGDLRVESRPEGVSVFINNRLVGETPLQLSLAEEVYEVKLVPEASKDKTYMTWSDKIRVYRDSTSFINRVLAADSQDMAGEMLRPEKSGSSRGQILITTEPSGLFVSLDGEERGLSSLFIDNIPSGSHELTIQGEGLLPRTVPVKVTDGYKILIDVSLAIDRQYVAKKKEANKKTAEEKKKVAGGTVVIQPTDTGWLRVRSAPSLDASESAKIDVGAQAPFFTQENGWYEIEYEEGKRGWISADYAAIVPETTP
ncbi:MAG: PEGA domain-containing protein [Candidatus Roizmanbacteria bacterium]|nr:PEGA domain-containing protein [Candidatus Roizmanbacteria bacterium]